ncbi:MAG TPA: transposase [Nevskiaceae bacterium]|nr:transposase [Nevskiaceae bacterium]
MARLPRLTAPGLPHYVIRSGMDTRPVFLDDTDRRDFMHLMLACAAREQVALHAWVLMPDEVQLLMTPANEAGLPRLMQALTRRYAQRFNRRHARHGTALWHGRYRATVMQPERHLLACMVLMDRLPLRAGLVGHAADYPWSTCRHYIGATRLAGVTAPAQYWALGNTPFEREAAYGKRVAAGLGEARRTAMIEATLKGWALGDTRFVAEVALASGRRAAPEAAGRPRHTRASALITKRANADLAGQE